MWKVRFLCLRCFSQDFIPSEGLYRWNDLSCNNQQSFLCSRSCVTLSPKTSEPTKKPTQNPTEKPSTAPTNEATTNPTSKPTKFALTESPTRNDLLENSELENKEYSWISKLSLSLIFFCGLGFGISVMFYIKLQCTDKQVKRSMKALELL